MRRAVLALDQGTTSSRALIVDELGEVVSLAQRPLETSFPRPGWVEQDPELIWRTQLESGREALAAAQGRVEVVAIGLANQRETTILWHRETGEPIGQAIGWQDRRTAEFCGRLREDPGHERLTDLTGLIADSYFSATKIAWMLDHVPDARELALQGKLAFGTVDSFLIHRLSGQHLTDATNASRTLLLNLRNLEWSSELLELFGIPSKVLPEIVPSSGRVAVCRSHHFGQALPICGVAGDQQAATFGQACFESGEAKTTYGTGCFALWNTGGEVARSGRRLLSTLAWNSPNTGRRYAIEGSVFVAGAAIQWLRDELGVMQTAEESNALASSVPNSAGVMFVPAFVGLGAPHWDAYARGTIVGLERGSTKAHLVRAALESVAFQTADVLDAIREDVGAPLRRLRVDGGAARNDFLMQFQADLLGIELERPRFTETTAMGAAYLAGLGAGLWTSLEEVGSLWKLDRRFTPSMSDDRREESRRRWNRALARARDWAEHS